MGELSREVFGFGGSVGFCGVGFCGAGGGGSKVLLGLLMSFFFVSVRSVSCSFFIVWTFSVFIFCARGVGVRGVEKGGLSVELGFVVGLSR